MAINISGVGTQPTLSTNKNDRVQKDEANNASQSSSVNSKESLAEDTVQLSSVAQSLQAKGSDNESEVDMDKVEQIKQAIAAGEYKIDTEKLASSMLSIDELFA
ncbi:flagellar biosynthesis anti-sigma factor FlgM [Marinomonas communis]|jgi:negative regulator of flagellin synthesis FlgM|uniref:Negative regulator of flagellin synthesis n=1 Tax=Marinomonas communis TaxID=28254 RepID=A0A4R6X6U4_9GAMM|nr:flagellar biosynthesis anti-sigma factor FlgM [Marinomonas communis]MCC4274480.1 flagellar biosynthesis anti-sigma factor FlgM [Marinomonas communis]TDR13200.1 FlgM family anti-sigma-28 factor [Marinomonas communis]|tara:strand:+ start:582 stop:893 length:312 start_codon:yes stop_codon:yes gene_type:complete